MTCSCSPEKKKKKERERKERKVSVGWCRHANGDRRRRLSLPHILKIERESCTGKEKNWKKKHTYRLWSPCSFCSVSSSKKPSSSVPPRGVFLRPLLFFRKRRCCCCCCYRSPSSPSFPSSSSSRVSLGNRRTHNTDLVVVFPFCAEKSRVISFLLLPSSFSLFIFSKTLNPKPFLFFGWEAQCAHNRRPFLSMGGSFTPPPK